MNAHNEQHIQSLEAAKKWSSTSRRFKAALDAGIAALAAQPAAAQEAVAWMTRKALDRFAEHRAGNADAAASSYAYAIPDDDCFMPLYAAPVTAAPGIDMGVPGATLTIDGETFTVDEVRLVLAGALADAKRLDFLIRTYSHLRMRNGAWVVAVGGETPAPGEGYPTACAAIDAAMQVQAGDAEVQP